MSSRPILIFGAFVALVAAIGYLAFSKEGSDKAVAVPVESADKRSMEIFATNCGTCHTLAAAGTDGVVGPNLDQILPTQVAPATGTPEEVAAANEQAYDAAYSRVLNAIVCGLAGRMPAGILQNDDAEDVSGFVAAYAGQLGEDQGPLVSAEDRPTPGAEPCSAGPGNPPAGGGAAPSE
jgi:mono/diheme cytochrome c family protein